MTTKEKIIRLIKAGGNNIDLAHALCIGHNISFSSMLFECNDYKIIGEAAQLEAVKRNGYALRYCIHPREAVQLEAVKQDGNALIYCTHSSDAVHIDAVKRKWKALQFCTHASEAVQIEAIKQNCEALQFCIWGK